MIYVWKLKDGDLISVLNRGFSTKWDFSDFMYVEVTERYVMHDGCDIKEQGIKLL